VAHAAHKPASKAKAKAATDTSKSG
jgi:hypothetical protein